MANTENQRESMKDLQNIYLRDILQIMKAAQSKFNRFETLALCGEIQKACAVITIVAVTEKRNSAHKLLVHPPMPATVEEVQEQPTN